MSQDQFFPSFEGTWARLSQVAVNGAEYNSRERQPHPKCLEGTRVDLLNYIYDSLDDREKNRLIWLHGTAGVGKSAVAFTVAEKMRGLKVTEQTYVEKRLAGTFFFSRKHTKRCTTGYFFATLVYQLATNFPSIRKDVNRAIRDNPALLDPDKALYDQMEALFLQPLRNLQLRLRGCPPLLFVIDALDECTSEPELTDLIHSLAQALCDPDIPMTHILLTSRSESHICKAFRNAKVQPLLCEIPGKTSGDSIGSIISLDGADVDKDIDIFLQNSFGELGSRHPDFPQPSRDQLAQLASRAGRRFIVASTMMKFIIDDEDNDPGDRLQLMLELTSELLPGTEVHKLYDSILSTCADPKRAFLHLSIVASLADPLSMSQISKLLGPGLGRDVETTLVQLRSVLYIPTDTSLPVNIHHSSIRDYVSNPSNSSLPHLHDIRPPHSLLAEFSLRLMMKEIPESTALLDALSELTRQSQAMQPQDPRKLKDSLAFLVRPPELLSVLIGMMWLRGDRSSDLRDWVGTVDGCAWLKTRGGDDWLHTQGGRDWLQTQGARNWLQTLSGQDWLQTMHERYWLRTQGSRDCPQIQGVRDSLQTQRGRAWLQTEVGRVWLQTPAGQDWLRTQGGQDWLWTWGGRGWLWTQGGQVWLQTPDLRAWLHTLGGQDWLCTKGGRYWLRTQGGQDWLQTQGGRDWLQTQGGRDWLQTQGRRDWLQTQGGRDWLQTQGGRDWLQTQSGRDWLKMGGQDWLKTQGGGDWLHAQGGNDWLQTQGGRGWLHTQGGDDWLHTQGGRDWLQTQRGRDWLQIQGGRYWPRTVWIERQHTYREDLFLTTCGPGWLPTTHRDWLQIPQGKTWLTTQEGQNWLQSQEGHDWLQTPDGEDWLQTQGAQNWLQTQRGQYWLQTQGGRNWLQTQGGREWLRSPSAQDWLQTLHNQGGQDWLQTQTGTHRRPCFQHGLQTHRQRRPKRSWLRWLQTQDGKDWMQTQDGKDWLQTPDARDWLQTQGGRAWLQSPNGRDWFQTQGGREWLQTTHAQDWLQTQGGQDWLQTQGGQDWLQTQGGQDWLQTQGQDWLQTQGGQDWLQTQGGRDWLQTQNGRDWLQIQGGCDWLQTQGGRDWLQSPSAQDWLQTQGGRAWLQSPEGRDWLQTQGGARVAPDHARARLVTDPGRDRLAADTRRDRLAADPGRERLAADPARERLAADCGRARLAADPTRARLVAHALWQSMAVHSCGICLVNNGRILKHIGSNQHIYDCTRLAFAASLPGSPAAQELMFPMFVALMHQDHSTSTLPEDYSPPDREITHAMNAFITFANETQEQSRLASEALRYACQNWAFHLSRAPNPRDDKLNLTFQVFWNRHLLSWFERQWCLKGLRSSLAVLCEGQNFAQG